MKKNLRGGKAEKLGWRPEQYDQRQLKIGTKHELEHTDDPTIARGIAMDHLAEQVLDGKTQDYYDRLAQLEPNRSKEELFRDWERLVNLSAEELESFLETPEGSVAGLSREEARRQGIGSGQESAQWIIRMKRTSPHDWTWKMWDWAQRQVHFIQRMSAMRGPLYDASGSPTRKLLSLLVWGHAPAEVLAVLRDTAPPTKAHGRRYVANESFDEKYERDQRIKRKTIEAWREEFNDKKILKVPGSDWHTITVTRSTRPGVKFQVTRWDLEDGALVPLGHMDITTSLDSALDELWWMADRKRYRENPRRPDYLATMKEWQRDSYLASTTMDPRESGFLLHDGTWIKMGMDGERGDDHRVVTGAVPVSDVPGYDDRYDGRYPILVHWMKETESIRWMPEACAFDIHQPPTEEQLDKILDITYVCDPVTIEMTDGDRQVEKEYPARSRKKMIADIRAFWR